jgi:hypothetical protein
MKPAILKRTVKGGNFTLPKGTKIYVAQKLNSGFSYLVRKNKEDKFEYPVPAEALQFVSDKIKVKIHVKRLPRRNDAMFYYDQHIATVSKGHREIIVESSGEMQAYFTEKGDCYRNNMLAKELRSRGTTDRGLSTLGANDRIQMNNWFRLVDSEKGGEEEIAHTYDEAIELAKYRINED